MPRRNRDRRAARREQPRRPLSGGWQQFESGPDGDWLVRKITAVQATKQYRCPGCDHEIQPGTAHVVVWPADDTGGVADRRHWHEPCWAARHRRRPTSRFW